MTVAARSALVLDAQLRTQAQRRPGGDLTGLAMRFQRALARSNQLPWLMSTAEDLRFHGAEGTRPRLPTRLVQRYLDRVVNAAAENPTVGRAFLNVAHLMTAPSTLFAPRVLIPALLHGGPRGLSAPPTQTPLAAVAAASSTAPVRPTTT
jgi:hypothetical protein